MTIKQVQIDKLTINTDQPFEHKLGAYPPHVGKKLHYLRALIHICAKELELTKLEETLKWGEPSFIANHGSTLRMDWKEKNPDQYALYFKCTSRLVETFKTVFGDTFTYEGNRAILFKMDQKIPKTELKKCIKSTLQYHKVKSKEMLGIK